MITVDIFCESRYQIDRNRIRKTLEDRLKEQGVRSDVEMSVSIVGERKMKDLHKKYLETYEVTDVISFPLEGVNYPDNVLRLGDIVVCFPVAVKQAGENNRLVDEEIDFLVDHGCLHLLGIHHD
jgi:probable rRNA maturation factor